MIKKIYFRFKRKILNILLKRFTSLYRPSSEPYISGDTFRKFSDHIYDQTNKLSPKNVKTNDIIFLKTELISSFFEHVNPKINSKYILISHNSDMEINNFENFLNDEKIIFWFAQNLNIKTSRNISVLPIGLENLRYQNNGILDDFDSELPESKQNKILCSFNLQNNNFERENLRNLSLIHEDIDVANLSNHRLYIKKLKNFKFNLCPSGNGLDTHRIWESLMVETIPVLVESAFANNLKTLNIPLLVLNKWEDLNTLDSQDLHKIYLNEARYKSFKDVLRLDFWIKTIESKKII